MVFAVRSSYTFRFLPGKVGSVVPIPPVFVMTQVIAPSANNIVSYAGQYAKVTLGENTWELNRWGALLDDKSVGNWKGISFKGWEIGDDEAELAAEFLLGHPEIISADFSGNPIGAKGLSMLAEWLKADRTEPLERVIFDGINIGDEGAKILAEVLKTSKIQKLSLQNCGIFDEGTSALAEAMKANQDFVQMTFYGNHIGNAGETALLAVPARIREIYQNDKAVRETAAANLKLQAEGQTLPANAYLGPFTVQQFISPVIWERGGDFYKAATYGPGTGPERTVLLPAEGRAVGAKGWWGELVEGLPAA